MKHKNATTTICGSRTRILSSMHLNNSTLKIGTDEWRVIMNKSGDLRGQKEAFHMGKMGMLDGEKAQEASEQSAIVPAGHEYAAGTDGVQPSIYTGDGRRRRETNQPAVNNAAAGHEYAAGTGGVQPEGSGEQVSQLESEKQRELDAAMDELDTQMAEEIDSLNDLRQNAYQIGYTFFDENIDLKGMRQSMIGQISSSLGIDASEFTDAELKEAFAQSTWVLDDAYDVSVDDIIEDIKTKYDKLKDAAIANVDDKFKPYERVVDAGFTDLISITDMLEDSEVKDVVSIMLGLTMNEDGAFSDTSSWSEVVFIPDEEAADEFYKKYVDDPEALAELNKKAQGWEVKILALPIVPALPQFGLVLEGAAWLEDAIDIADIISNSTHLTDKLNVGSYYVKYNTSSTFNGMGSTKNNYTVLCEVDEKGNLVEPPHLYAYVSTSTTIPTISPNGGQPYTNYDTDYYEYGN